MVEKTLTAAGMRKAKQISLSLFPVHTLPEERRCDDIRVLLKTCAGKFIHKTLSRLIREKPDVLCPRVLSTLCVANEAAPSTKGMLQDFYD